MLILLSPAKKLDEKPINLDFNFSNPDFLQESKELIDVLKEFNPNDISKLMSLSDKLGELNYSRFQAWKMPFDKKTAKPSIYMFKGDAYRGLEIETFEKQEVEKLNGSLRILSGLYGLLRPLDLILPYRLEMKTKIMTKKGKTLYDFWDDDLTNMINDDLKNHKEKVLVNLASNEYFKAINTKKIDSKLITPIFKEDKSGTYKIIAINAKRARGLMTRFIIKNNIERPNDLKAFDSEGYFFNNNLSNENEFVFTR